MGIIDTAVDIADLGQRNLWVAYGKSGVGKTDFLASFPKPMLYVQIGDDGSNTIADYEGISALKISDPNKLKTVLEEAKNSKKYKTIAVDTFSLFVNDWIDINAVQKKKRVTMQMWGDIKTDTEELIKLAHVLAEDKYVVLTCHEVVEVIESEEDMLAPDVRPSVSKGARTYLESMANYGIHLAVLIKEKEQADGSTKEVAVHIAHLAANPNYWVKTQKSKDIKLPKSIVNPTFDKIMKRLKGE